MRLPVIEVAELTGGAGDNTFAVSGWTGSAALTGLGGEDTYSFGDTFGDVTIDRRRNLFLRSIREVIRLAEHRPEIRHLPIRPLQHFGPLQTQLHLVEYFEAL